MDPIRTDRNEPEGPAPASAIRRRTFLGGLIGGAAWAPVLTATGPQASGQSVPVDQTTPASAREVRLEYLRPRQIDEAMQANPTLFQPLGTVEWHGLHNWVGVDALKAHLLCERAARRSGGLVAPALYGGVGGLDQPHTFVMDSENDTESLLVRPWVEKLCLEGVRQGFRAIIILTGHYGAAQQMVIRELAVRMTRITGVPVLGTPEYFLAHDVEYYGDHAAWGETSLMMYLAPESVALEELGDAPHQGVGGRDPKLFATAEDGQKLAETIIGRLAGLAGQMHRWSADEIQQFADAEAAIVARQMILAGQNKNIWSAWRNIPKGVFAQYGPLLLDRRFDAIRELTEQL